MKTTSLVNLSTPFSYASIDRGVKDSKLSDLEAYLNIKKSEYDKRVQIWDWIESMEDGTTIEEILNSIIKIKKEQTKGILIPDFLFIYSYIVNFFTVKHI